MVNFLGARENCSIFLRKRIRNWKRETQIGKQNKNDFRKQNNNKNLIHRLSQVLWVCSCLKGTQVQFLVQEDSTCHGATELRGPELLSPHTTTAEAWVTRACALQQVKPPQWETWAPREGDAPILYN